MPQPPLAHVLVVPHATTPIGQASTRPNHSAQRLGCTIFYALSKNGCALFYAIVKPGFRRQTNANHVRARIRNSLLGVFLSAKCPQDKGVIDKEMLRILFPAGGPQDEHVI
jgi:hypothetical protein